MGFFINIRSQKGVYFYCIEFKYYIFKVIRILSVVDGDGCLSNCIKLIRGQYKNYCRKKWEEVDVYDYLYCLGEGIGGNLEMLSDG